jgi:drug/metabolite transporter (DMT)-like permease
MLRSLIFLAIGISLTVCGELLLKRGMTAVGELDLFSPAAAVGVLFRAFTNPFVLGGFMLIFGGAIFWLAVISRLPLSVAYPMLGLSYVLGVGASWLLFNEHINGMRIIGVAIIVTGVALVGLSYQGAAEA